MGICRVNKLVVGNKNTEKGSIQIYGKDIDILKLGDATHEGGDVKIYRDTSGNLQLSIDADAASNAKAVDIYGGVVAQHFLTVGQAALNTTYPLYVEGNTCCHGSVYLTAGAGTVYSNNYKAYASNLASLPISISVSGTDATDHAVKLQIDSNDIIIAQATGDGAGGIDAATKAIGFFGVTPQVQQNHIADPTDLASCISALSTLLADLEGYGMLKAS